MADSGIKRIPVKLGDFSVLDTEFSNIRERFDAEMKKMEDEMARFRCELMNSESNLQSSTSTTTTEQSPSKPFLTSRYEDVWVDNPDSPLIEDKDEKKTLKLRFDLSEYSPEEIALKTVNNMLLVHAKHEQRTGNNAVYREYNRKFLLPRGATHENIKSTLSKDGVLTVEAPLPSRTGETVIPIAHQ